MLIAYVLSCLLMVALSMAAAKKRPAILAAYVPAFLLLSLVFIALIVVLEG